MGSLNPFAKPKDKVTSSIPSWLDQAGQDAINRATTIANTPYTPYPGQRVANSNENLDLASDVARNAIGKFEDPYFNTGRNMITDSVYHPTDITARDVNAERIGTDSFSQDALSQYMNPFVKAALDPASREIQRQSDQYANTIGAKAASRGAFGGSRQGLLEAENQRNTGQQISDLYSKGYSNAYDKATNLFTSDEQRALDAAAKNQSTGLQADEANQQKDYNVNSFNEGQKLKAFQTAIQGASALSSMGKNLSDIKNDNMNRLLTTGNAERTQQQQNLDSQYSQFKDQQGYPATQLNILLNAIKGAPYSAGKVTTTPGTNQMADNIGTAAQLATLFATMAA